MWIFTVIPFFLQAIAILFDEGYFHVRRGLPKWERIGHPLDTFSLLVCLWIILFVPYSSEALKVYCGCAILSCILVTKDEFIHKHHSPAAENWLHAFLFILHPITLTLAALMWPVIQEEAVSPTLAFWFDQPEILKNFMIVQTAIIAVFFLYQIIFWNFIWKNKPVLKQ